MSANFSQTSDDEVVACLQRARRPEPAARAVAGGEDPSRRDEEVSVTADAARTLVAGCRNDYQRPTGTPDERSPS